MTGRDPARIRIREARLEHVPGIVAVLVANDEPIADAGGGTSYIDGLLAEARVLVALADDDVVGFGATIQAGTPSGPDTHLADLFVRPSFHGRGVGHDLMGALFDGVVGDRSTFSSADPRALPLYTRFGMAPLWPNLYLGGIVAERPTEGPFAAGGEGLSLATIEWTDVIEVTRQLTGWDVAPATWMAAMRPGAKAFAVLDRGRPVAVGHSRDALRNAGGRWIGRLAAVDDPSVDPVDVVVAVLLAEGVFERWVGLPLLGPHPALPVLLDAGLRIDERDTFHASRSDLVDPTRLVPDPATL